jgi:tellurite resistance protein
MSPSVLVRDGVPDWPRFPPNLFGICFGLVGLADVWHAAEPTLHTSESVPDAISLVAAVVWAVLVVCYALQGVRSFAADFRHRVFSPFIALAPITGMLLSATLAVRAFEAGRALVVVFLVLTLLVGGLLTGEWIVADLDHDSAHPGYFLPTVAGGLVGAFCASQVGLKGLAEASFGVGMLCWIMIGSTIVNRLFFHTRLPAPLVPTLAIELAPPAVAGLAYFSMTGDRRDIVSYGFAGYTVLMALVQVRMLPTFLRLRFGAGFWAFTFAWSAAVAYALAWIALEKVSGARVYATLLVAAMTLAVVVIAVKTLVLLRDGKLLPARQGSAS